MDGWNRIWKHKKFANSQKYKYFLAFIVPIFLYNSEIWSMTSNLKDRIDAFQRRLIRRVINIKYPKKISTEELNKKMKYEKWSDKIEARRLRMWGHMVRLPEDTPVQKAMAEAERIVKKPTGRPTQTWLGVMKKQIEELGLSWEEAKEAAQD